MTNKTILHYLNDNLKTDYIRIKIKEGICNNFAMQLSTDWMFSSEYEYEEKRSDDYLTLVKDEMIKIQNHYDFAKRLSEVKLNKLYDLYNLNINDNEIISSLNGLEWDLHNPNEEYDNEIVQDIINKKMSL